MIRPNRYGKMLAAAGFLVCGRVLAQTEAPVPAPVSTAMELKQQGMRLEVLARTYRNQQDAITQEIVDLDAEIEQHIKRIVDLLSSVEDSEDSRIKVIQTQELALDSLKKTVEFYARERQQRQAALSQPYALPIAEDDLEQDVKALQAKIDTRVEQIVQLTHSLVQNPDFKKTASHYDGAGNYRKHSESGPAHDRATAHRASIEADKLKDAFEAAIANLKRDNAEMKKQLAVTGNQEERERLQAIVDFNDTLLVKRQSQLDGLLSPPPARTRPVGSKDAIALKEDFRDEADGIRRQHQELVRLSARRDRIRIELKTTMERLAQTQAALEAAAAQ